VAALDYRSFTSFSDDGPWELESGHIAWQRGIEHLRVGTRAQVPRLLARRILPPGVRVAEVGARIGGAVLGWAATERRRGGSVSKAGLSRRMRMAFTALGPSYIKMGQVLSSGEGIFPPELVSEFRLLRDRVPPESFDAVRATVEADLGRRLEDVFSSFAREPIAAASIAQVHRATLVSGEDVVVKVQRPDIARKVARDIAAMAWLARLLTGRIPVTALANPPAIVELLAETIVEELDFRLEAQNMLDVAAVLHESNQRAIVVPRPHPTLVTARVLVMERLSGFSFDDVAGMRAAGIDTTAVVRAGMVMLFEGSMIYGVFHGDLHGGNLIVLHDGRVGLLDHGITGRFDEVQRVAFLRMLLAAITNDVEAQIVALRELGAFPPDADATAIAVDLGLHEPPPDPSSMDAEELLAQMRELAKSLLGHGARLPKELVLFLKDMIFIDGAVATLAPDLDLVRELTSVFTAFFLRHGAQIAGDVGVDPTAMRVDLGDSLTQVGLDATGGLTYRDIQRQRDEAREKFEELRRRRE
jgi:ubiquinone biosynthesis protein